MPIPKHLYYIRNCPQRHVIWHSWSGQALSDGGRIGTPVWQNQPSAASRGAIGLPYRMFVILRFGVTILAMALFSRRARAPAALLIPFRREER